MNSQTTIDILNRLLETELMAVSNRAAPKSAGKNFVDIKIMYRIGTVARGKGLCDWEYVMGILLSTTGKSIYFDR